MKNGLIIISLYNGFEIDKPIRAFWGGQYTGSKEKGELLEISIEIAQVERGRG